MCACVSVPENSDDGAAESGVNELFEEGRCKHKYVSVNTFSNTF